MHQSNQHRAASRAAPDRPRVLYPGTQRNITWALWCQARAHLPVLDQIEDLAFRIYRDIPNNDPKHPRRVRRELEAAMSSAAVNETIELLHELPSRLRPAREINPLFVIALVIKLEACTARASAH